MGGSDDVIDLGRYLERIGYGAETSPTTSTLDAIIAHHAAAIPFENLDPFTARPNLIDIPPLQHKLIDSRRGGYCFEHNLVLRSVLLSLGYEVTALSARVLWGTGDYVLTQRSHMLLMVRVGDEPRLVDVGFGGMTPTTSLRFDTDLEQLTPLEPFRLTTLGGDYALQAKLDETWRSIYRFDMTPQHPFDFEAINWYLSTWPHSRFVTGLAAARATSDRRYALGGKKLNIHRPNQASESREISDVDDLTTVLENDFLIDTRGIAVDHVFARLS